MECFFLIKQNYQQGKVLKAQKIQLPPGLKHSLIANFLENDKNTPPLLFLCFWNRHYPQIEAKGKRPICNQRRCVLTMRQKVKIKM